MKKEGEADVSEFLAKRITMRFIRKFQIKEEDWDLYYLGIEVIVTTALTSLMIMALGIALRNFFGSVVFLLCFMRVIAEDITQKPECGASLFRYCAICFHLE